MLEVSQAELKRRRTEGYGSTQMEEEDLEYTQDSQGSQDDIGGCLAHARQRPAKAVRRAAGPGCSAEGRTHPRLVACTVRAVFLAAS